MKINQNIETTEYKHLLNTTINAKGKINRKKRFGKSIKIGVRDIFSYK